MKIKEDTLPKAKEVLSELISIQQSLYRMREALCPFDADAKQTYGSLPKFLVARRAVLQSYAIKGFSVQYPHVNLMISDGMNDDAGMFRLHDGVYKLGQAMQALQACKFMVKTDAECMDIHTYVSKSLADFTVFVITQYGLADTDEYVLLSVSDYCGREGMTPEVFYGSQLTLLEATGESVYGYESISPYKDDLLDIDATFVAECEEANFPLTDTVSKAIISGELPIAEARGQLQTWLEQMEQKEVKGITLRNMVQKMNLG